MTENGSRGIERVTERPAFSSVRAHRSPIESVQSASVRQLVANNLPHLFGCDRLFGRAYVLPERVVDERLIPDTRPHRLRLECSDDLIVDVDGDARLSLRWHRLPAPSFGKIVLSLHNPFAPSQ